ncbi:hypothetical protein K0M31_009993 [Melipona bicolor]|uniref:Uncharacterized protein n=1 Tax=Melipona bicolor TaxID=60889 RepID=A0AA40FN13_9HYME|nr:hypothetical protein K0M31_009993 [Melipona bicolor]
MYDLFACNITYLINKTTYLHMHPTESPLFGSCQLLATQALRLCSIPAEPLSVQAQFKRNKRNGGDSDGQLARYRCHQPVDEAELQPEHSYFVRCSKIRREEEQLQANSGNE